MKIRVSPSKMSQILQHKFFRTSKNCSSFAISEIETLQAQYQAINLTKPLKQNLNFTQLFRFLLRF